MSAKDDHPGRDPHDRNPGHPREGAKQPEVFRASRAAMLDDPERFGYLPPDKIVALLDAPEDGVVVDFGAGTGTFSMELAKRRPDVRIIALDQQPEMLKLLESKPALQQLRNIRPMLADQADSLKGAADRILAVNVLHELGDEALQGMAELLKPQGSVLVVDWDSAVERPIGPPKDHTYTPAEAHERLSGAGFDSEALPSLPYHFVLRARRQASRPR